MIPTVNTTTNKEIYNETSDLLFPPVVEQSFQENINSILQQFNHDKDYKIMTITDVRTPRNSGHDFDEGFFFSEISLSIEVI